MEAESRGGRGVAEIPGERDKAVCIPPHPQACSGIRSDSTRRSVRTETEQQRTIQQVQRVNTAATPGHVGPASRKERQTLGWKPRALSTFHPRAFLQQIVAPPTPPWADWLRLHTLNQLSIIEVSH